jgi:hypothetical protein
MFMVVDPSLGAPLLEPLFRAQDTPAYTLAFAASDLGQPSEHSFRPFIKRKTGSTYPNVTAQLASHSQGVEREVFR